MHSRAVFISFVFLIALAAHVFVALWLLDSAPRLRRHRGLVVGIAIAVCTATAVGRFGAITAHGPVMVTLVASGLTEWMIVILGAIPLGLVLGAARLARRLSPEKEAPEREDGGPPLLTRREAVERLGGALALGASTACLGWGMVRGRHAFVVEEVPVRIVGLPRALDGYTIAQVSDVHAGVFVGARELDEGLALLGGIRPDLVVVTGDMVDFDARFMPALAATLGRLPSRDGIFAVLGNHDYQSGCAQVTEALRGSGVRLLVNEGVPIRPDDGGGFALLGVDDLWAARWNGVGPDLARAIETVAPDAPRILLAHQPQYFDHAGGKVALQLSGHTHGGQINPGFRPADFFMRYISGRYEKKGSTLWVNRGFGVAGPPARLGAPPEVTKIVLVAA